MSCIIARFWRRSISSQAALSRAREQQISPERPRLSTRRAEKRSPAAVAAGDQSLRIVLRINLGSFTSSGRVALARIGFRLLRKREILSFRLLQNFSFSPPVVERDPCADEEHHPANRNSHPWGLARGDFCSCSMCSRGTGSVGRRAGSRDWYSRVRDRFG